MSVPSVQSRAVRKSENGGEAVSFFYYFIIFMLDLKQIFISRVRVTNRKQFEMLVAQMEAHPAVAKGLKFCAATGSSEATYEGVWKNITLELNSVGPPTRTAKEWQKVWSDYKLKIKGKLAHNKREANATGGGPNTMKVLSPTEETVVKLLSFDRAVNHSGLYNNLEA